MELRRRRTTARDVAMDARVSTATVSLVVNDKARGRVAEATQVRVRDAIERLGYRPDGLARSLATGMRPVVALVAPDLTNPFYLGVARGVGLALGDRYLLLLVMPDLGQQQLQSSVEQVLGLGVSGMLIDAPRAAMVRQLKPVCPVVLMDAPGAGGIEPRVNFDLARGARELAEHLVSQGHRCVAYLDASSGSATFSKRRRAFEMRLQALHGDIAQPPAVSEIDLTAAAAVSRAHLELWLRGGATALVCATDLQAYGALAAASELRIGVPLQLAVAGFDDLPFSRTIQPPLTSVSLSAADLGYQAARVLRGIMEGNHHPRPVTRIPSTLHVRASTLTLPE